MNPQDTTNQDSTAGIKGTGLGTFKESSSYKDFYTKSDEIRASFGTVTDALSHESGPRRMELVDLVYQRDMWLNEAGAFREQYNDESRRQLQEPLGTAHSQKCTQDSIDSASAQSVHAMAQAQTVNQSLLALINQPSVAQEGTAVTETQKGEQKGGE